MANPFLFDDDLTESGTETTACNPFLMDTTDDGEDAENPFMSAQTINPFEYDNTTQIHTDDSLSTGMMLIENETNNQVPSTAMTFTNDAPHLPQFGGDNNEMYSSSREEELSKKKEPPPRPNPPSQTTQDLIFAVADQLDQASSQMLGRLPATRTPSPVSMRDLHSPSPFADADTDLVDVLSDHGSGTDWMDSSAVDNPFAINSTDNLPTEMTNLEKSQPPQMRPPPPRPVPPRPGNPPITQPSTQQQQQPPSQEPDLFDLLGDTKPQAQPAKPAPKTKEDILSLFSAPKIEPQQQQQQQPDLLSGDILLDAVPSEEMVLPPPFSIQPTEQPLISVSSPQVQNTAQKSSTVEEIAPEQSEEISTVENGNELITETKEEIPEETTQITAIEEQIVVDSIAPEINYRRVPTPDIEITTVEDLPRSDDEEEQTSPAISVSAPAEAEQVEDKQDSDKNGSSSSPPETQHIADHGSEPEQMDTGLDFISSIPSESTSANPFASPESEDVYPTAVPEHAANIFGVDNQPEAVSEPTNIFATSTEPTNIFATNADLDIFAPSDMSATGASISNSIVSTPFCVDHLKSTTGGDEFDAFSAKFESAKKDDASLLGSLEKLAAPATLDAWGSSTAINITETSTDGFGNEDSFDPFYAMDGQDVESPEKEFSVVIRPKDNDAKQRTAPLIAPPPPPPRAAAATTGSVAIEHVTRSEDLSLRINPFDKIDVTGSTEAVSVASEQTSIKRTDSQETPATPLFDEDVSQPLEDFPRIFYKGPGWDMQLRQPNKKKITGQRFWKKIFLRLVFQGDNPVLQLFNQQSDKEPFQELPLQPSYSVSEIGAQQYDQFGKIFTVKLQYIFYKERPGVRPGQVTKAERITNKLSQFAAYAIQGDYQGVKEFGSDLKKLGLPVEHAPQVSQLFKIGSTSYEDLKQFSICIEEALFKLSAHRDRALTYKFEEVQITAVDEIYVEQNFEGHVEKQIARVRLFFLAFLSGMPIIELGVNDLIRQGKEVVGRHDIIPVVTEEWIRLEGVEFHSTVQQDEYERTRTIKFQPPDACYIELMRFRVRPPKNRELPLQLKATWCVTGNRVELRADVLVPGFASRKLGQIPCEDVSIRFPIPECWIYLFRVEKHFRYGSVKSAHRRTGKIKGIERILGAVDQLQESLIEVTSGQAKYEHHHRALVWRCPRLPKEGQGAYTTHQLVCRMALTSYDQIPEQLAPYCYVEFTMPATQVSHTTVRSVSVQNSDSDEPPEKYVRYLARHEYRVGIEHTTGESANPYLAATRVKEESPQPQQQQPAPSPMAPSDSDSESN